MTTRLSQAQQMRCNTPPPSIATPHGGKEATARRTMARTLVTLVVACAVIGLSTSADARCVKHTGGASERDIASSSAKALAAWVAEARKRGPEFGDWAKARNMDVNCHKVIAGSGRARGPRWVCEASGSSSDVVGGEACPK